MRHFNYKHLHYFWVVAREGSIARASERLFLTPQTISGQLAELEHQIGEKLFSRASRGLQLTEIGEVVFQYADEMFQLGSELKDVLEGRLPGGVRAFSVGVVDDVPKMVAYRVLEPALRLAEPVRIHCREGRLEELLAELSMHKLDMVLAETPIGPGLNIKAYNHPLGESGTSFLVARRLQKLYRKRFPQCLDANPMLLPTANSYVRRALDHWLERQGVQPRVTGEFQDSALMKVFGANGAGVFVVPTAIEPELLAQYDVAVLGRTDEVRARFYAISAERRIKHPAVVAITTRARSLFQESSTGAA
jgi:LysR family transcriptional activator of nhaA